MKNFKKKEINSSNGITLIALVITIIVLLILAGISISMLSGDNGILQKATDAKTRSDEAQIIERIQLAYHSALTGGQGSYTKESLESELEKEFGENNYNVDDSDSENWILTGKLQEKEQSITIPAGEIVDTTWQKAFEFPEQHFTRYTLDEENKIINLLPYGPYFTAKNIEVKKYAIINGKKYVTKFPDSMFNYFYGTSSEKIVIDSKIDMSNVTSMNQLFCGSASLKEVSFSNSTTNNVTDLESMFKNCNSLEHVYLTGLNTENVETMRMMFYNCSKINNLDLSSLTTNNVKYMENMFKNCEELNILNLSNWNTEKVEQMGRMFEDCSNLTKIIVSDTFVTTNVRNFTMFDGCTKLIGGNETSFDSSKTDETMAWIDGKDDKEGYFSEE